MSLNYDSQGEDENLEDYLARLNRQYEEMVQGARNVIEGFKALTPENPSPPKILLIENLKDPVEVLKFTLKELGFEIILPTGHIAVDIAKQMRNRENSLSEADLIICDLNMPEVNGIEIAKLVELNSSSRFQERENISLKPGTKFMYYIGFNEHVVPEIFEGEPLTELDNGTYNIYGRRLVVINDAPQNLVLNIITSTLGETLKKRQSPLPDEM